MLVPLIGILYALWSGLPKLYRWEMQHRIYRHYGELKWIERELRDAPPGPPREKLLGRLAQLEQRVAKMRLPNAYAALGYTLKMHIRMARQSPGADTVEITPGPT